MVILTELELLLNQAKKTDSKLYTEKSYKNLLDVIKATEKALENKNELTQEEVDALTGDLRKAMEALEKLPVIKYFLKKKLLLLLNQKKQLNQK